MTDSLSIKCPKCGEFFEPGDAFRHQISEQILSAEKTKHEAELHKIREETAKAVAEKMNEEAKEKMDRLEKDAIEEKDRNRKLLKQLEDMTGELRAMRRKDEERELEMKKKLADEEAKIREEARKKFLEEHDLKDREKDQNYQVALKQIEDLKAKLQQGSQQAQGESLEIALEELLRREFPRDRIEEVKKGQRGADIVQYVVDKNGRECGQILWESKNAQWSDSWIPKLKDDQRTARADIAIIVVTNMPKNATNALFEQQVWICPRNQILPLAMSLRYGLIRVQLERNTQIGRDEKKEILYEYITSLGFRQRMEAISEAFSAMQEEVEREKRWFSTKWARQEKQLRKVIDHTHGMYGDLQGVVGNLPELKAEPAGQLIEPQDALAHAGDKPY